MTCFSYVMYLKVKLIFLFYLNGYKLLTAQTPTYLHFPIRRKSLHHKALTLYCRVLLVLHCEYIKRNTMHVVSVTLSPVLGALAAASGRVFHTKTGQKVVIECGVKSYTDSLRWSHGSEMIIDISSKGLMRKGRHYNRKLEAFIAFRYGLLLINLHVFAAAGKSDIAGKSSLRGGANVQISNVKEKDAGQFTCLADGKSQTHTLLVFSGRKWTRGRWCLQILFILLFL